MKYLKNKRIIAVITLVVGIFLYPADPQPKPPGEHKGYYILEADFHTHSFLAGAFPMPWDIVEMARKQNLHAIGMVEHNSIIGAEMAELYAKWFRDDTIVLVGEEVTTPRHHILLLGLEETISAGLPPEEVIKQAKAQGAVSILAHPARKFWPSYNKVRFEVDAVEAATGSARRELMKRLNPGQKTAAAKTAAKDKQYTASLKSDAVETLPEESELAKSVREARKKRGWSPYDMKFYYERINVERAALNAGIDPVQALKKVDAEYIAEQGVKPTDVANADPTDAKFAGKVVGKSPTATVAENKKYYKPLAATANSDYHGLLFLGYVRTIVFAKEKTAEGIIDAVRNGNTLAYYGDTSEMIGPQKWKDFLAESEYKIAGGIYDYDKVPSASIPLTLILFFAFGYLYLSPKARD